MVKRLLRFTLLLLLALVCRLCGCSDAHGGTVNGGTVNNYDGEEEEVVCSVGMDGESKCDVQELVEGMDYEQRRRVPESLQPSELPGPDKVRRRVPGSLRPSDLPGPDIFTHFDSNLTIKLPGKASQPVRTGSVTQINQVDSAAPAEIAVLPNIVDKGAVRSMLDLLRAYKHYDEDPDTVDGMPTYEIFVDSPDMGGPESMKVLDHDPRALPERNLLRKKLRTVTDPILAERITPFVQQHYHVCNTTEDRMCTPCYSLIRRYRHGERKSHATHHDGHAIVTVVVSLSDYGTEYAGGLYVSTGYGQKKYLALNAGDAVTHQSTLLHGVQVLDLTEHPENTERWSWILWYRDSVDCTDYSHEWFADCSATGDAVCQELHATKIGHAPGLSNEEQAEQVLELNRAAAEKGSGTAAVKMARAYLKQLPSKLEYNATEAVRYYQMAVASHHPDGHYGMAQILALTVAKAEATGKLEAAKHKQKKQTKMAQVVWHLEEASLLGHAFAMFNLGIAHVYGYGTNKIDTDLAASWLIQSGLPEGYYVASYQAASVGDKERQEYFNEQAKVLGYYHPWRKEARQRTGSGGAGGVDINIMWPTAEDGRRPPLF